MMKRVLLVPWSIAPRQLATRPPRVRGQGAAWLLVCRAGDLRVGDHDARHLSEHLAAHRQDEREAVIALHPADRNAHEITVLVEHAAAGTARVPFGQPRHATV